MTAAPQHKIRRKRLSEELTAQLRKYIIDNDLKPGDPLPTENEMVERFGVSHTVVREATKALDFLGIIDAAPRRGMIVDEFNFQRVSEYFGFHFALCDYPKDELLGSRAAIELGVLPYTMKAMRKDPALYPRLAGSGPIGARRRDAPTIAGSPTTSLFIGRWSRRAVCGRWRRSAICCKRSFTNSAST